MISIRIRNDRTIFQIHIQCMYHCRAVKFGKELQIIATIEKVNKRLWIAANFVIFCDNAKRFQKNDAEHCIARRSYTNSTRWSSHASELGRFWKNQNERENHTEMFEMWNSLSKLIANTNGFTSVSWFDKLWLIGFIQTDCCIGWVSFTNSAKCGPVSAEENDAGEEETSLVNDQEMADVSTLSLESTSFLADDSDLATTSLTRSMSTVCQLIF